jgi:DNA polymerase III alpha subunit
MAQYEVKWFAGAEANRIPRKVADDIWHKILQFGSYGFNKSHSASYALQAYQDMWLKVKYPAAFYAAFLTYEDDEDKRKVALREAKARDIDIVLPDVNLSHAGYTVDEQGRLVLGLTSIKGVGERSANQLIKQRPFASLEDFFQRGSKEADTRALIEAGALDSLADREYLLSTVEKVGSKSAATWQVFEHLKHNLKLKKHRDVPETRFSPSQETLARLQGAALNMPLSSLFMTDEDHEFISSHIWTPDEIDGVPTKFDVVVGGEITNMVVKKTAKGKTKGQEFANVTIVFDQHEWSVKFWPDKLNMYRDLLTEGQVILVAGKKDVWNGFVSVTASVATSLAALMESEAAERKPEQIAA